MSLGYTNPFLRLCAYDWATPYVQIDNDVISTCTHQNVADTPGKEAVSCCIHLLLCCKDLGGGIKGNCNPRLLYLDFQEGK